MLYAQNGIFGLNEAVDLGVDESYVGNTGALNSLIENVINDQKIFDGVMCNEITEASKIFALKSARESGNIEQEAVAEQELIAFQEASLGDMAKAVIAFIQKCAKKLKGLILAFVTKVGAILTRDNKVLVSKYKNKVIGKDLSKLKYKWNQPKGSLEPTETVAVAIATTGAAIDQVIKIKDQDDDSQFDNDARDKTLSDSSKISNTSFKTYKKDSFEAHFDSSEEITGLDKNRLTIIIKTLEESGKKIEGFKRLLPKIDQVYSKAITAAKNAEKNAKKNIETDSSKEQKQTAKIGGKDIEYGGAGKVYADGEMYSPRSSSQAAKILHNIQKAIGIRSQVSTLIFKTSVNEYKFHVKQCRAVFVKAAVSSARQSASESAVYLDAVAEADSYEFDSELELAELN